MKNQSISILGSTGSIGTQALDVVEKLGLRVVALSANRNEKLLEQQIRKFRPKIAVLGDQISAGRLRENLRDMEIEILSGEEGVCEAASDSRADLVLNAIVGIAGLRPTIAVLEAKKTLALANKESLVTGGRIVIETARRNGVKILPVDSEHSAIFQCLQGSCDAGREVKKILLTASGGPFYGFNRSRLEKVTPAQALKHPNWSMGAKITIDSATLMNKGLELMEAAWLFGVQPSRIEILVHRESIVHSAVEFVDHSVIAQLGVADMRIPIQYALTWPKRFESPVRELDLFEAAKLTFARPDLETFQCLRVCINAMEQGGLAPAAANGANEQAVALFLDGKIRFTDIGELVGEAVRRQCGHDKILKTNNFSLEDIFTADRLARELVLSLSGQPGNKA